MPPPIAIICSLINGTSLNLITLDDEGILKLASDLAQFLKELQLIKNVDGPLPGQHNWWRGDHVSFYDSGAREQFAKLANIIDSNKARKLWEEAKQTRWHSPPVWIHGDLVIGNILVKDRKLSAVIDFGGIALGDPACDLVIAWTFFTKKARDIFIKKMALDDNTWLRAKAWALWKASFELCQIEDKNSKEALTHKEIIKNVLS